MSRATRARAGLLTLALCSMATRAARAEPTDGFVSPPFQLAYDAPLEGCPDAQAFLGAIRARTERARIAGPGETAVAIAVRIKSAPGRPVVGSVEIREPDGVGQERKVESATCKEVAQALALVVALYLDPDAIAAPEPPPERPRPPPERRPHRPPPPPRRLAPSPPSPVARREPAASFGAGIGLGIASGLGPSVAPLARVFGEASIEGAAIDRALSWARPSVRLSLDAATTGGEVAAGSQRYVLVAGALRLCPVDVAVARGLHVGPCGGVQAGIHRGTSEGVPNAKGQDKPWTAPLTTVHSSLLLGRAVSVELEGGIAVPLVRTRFFLGPDVTLFRTPAVAVTASAAMTIWFR